MQKEGPFRQQVIFVLDGGEVLLGGLVVGHGAGGEVHYFVPEVF